MAKAKNPMPPDAATDPVAVAGLVESPPAGVPRWRVSLTCPTRIVSPTLDVEGATPDEAKAAFLAANGITASVHPFTIERLP